MKTRFNTYDVICAVSELQKCIGMRVNQVYDIDNKTYLIRLQRTEEKCIILIESGNRFHSTGFEWPKNVAPSGFSMKMRKHLKNKRLEKLTQLGVDRVVDFQFGMGEAAYHVILELYDRGNIILADHEWTILNVLRPHTEGEAIRFAVREKYPLDRAKETFKHPNKDEVITILNSSKPGDNLKKILNPHLEYGPAIIDHILLKNGLSGTMRLVKDPKETGFYIERDVPKLLESFELADKMMETAKGTISKGYIIQKKEDRPATTDGPKFILANVEFHPFLFAQLEQQPYKEFETFDLAVDEFFSTMESQKIDLKAVQIEREACKKLTNVKKDHEKRLTELEKTQVADKEKAELIMQNQQLVEAAILAVQTAIANQMPWPEIKTLIKTAQTNKDPIALCIKQLKLETNTISLILKNPYETSDTESDEEEEIKTKKKHKKEPKGTIVDVDLALSTFANARRYFDQKRSAAKKQQKTIESHGKALKSAEKKTMQTLKEVQAITNINKARKIYWFEKFFWFISSENYLVIGGRDQQQNELLVKRYMRATDIYVHADLSGASSIIIKNPTGNPVPPKTLNEAGQMAVSYSIAWEAKVVASAWWVNASQVSKTAPTGEYLTTGSFMIRGKKNFLPPCHLILGFSFMFRLEENSIERHLNERRVIVLDDDLESVTSSQVTENEDQEIAVSEGEDNNEDDKKLSKIVEQADEMNISGQNNESSDSESEDNYPNTHIKVEHDTGKIIVKNTVRTTSMFSSECTENNEDENVIYLGDDKPIVINNMANQPKKTKSVKPKATPRNEVEVKDNKTEENQSALGQKRGKAGKLKKIKNKYKDFDEEDKLAHEALWKSGGSKKEDKKTAKNQPKKKIPIPKPVIIKKEKGEVTQQAENVDNISDNENQEEAENETVNVAAETDMLCQLTGSPVQEDELLFSVPVVAPYSALQNYKFKIKLTPGTGRRGKAAKTAVEVFLRDKQCSQREKDLLKAVKDETIARNFPGKVKLSAPQLHKHKK